MKTKIPNDPVEHIVRMRGYIGDTRRYGSTYVHSEVRSSTFAHDVVSSANINGRPVRLRYTGYGRSLQSGGHKYKAYSWYRDTNRPVASKDLEKITA